MPVPLPPNGERATIREMSAPTPARAAAGSTSGTRRRRQQRRRMAAEDRRRPGGRLHPPGLRNGSKASLLRLDQAHLAHSGEQALVDLAVVDRHRLLVAQPDHLFALQVELLGELLRRQMVRHASTPCRRWFGATKKPTQRWLAWWVPMAPGLSLIAGNSGLLRSRIHVRIVAWCPDAVNRSDGVRDVDEDVLDAEPRCGQ